MSVQREYDCVPRFVAWAIGFQCADKTIDSMALMDSFWASARRRSASVDGTGGPVTPRLGVDVTSELLDAVCDGIVVRYIHTREIALEAYEEVAIAALESGCSVAVGAETDLLPSGQSPGHVFPLIGAQSGRKLKVVDLDDSLAGVVRVVPSETLFESMRRIDGGLWLIGTEDAVRADGVQRWARAAP